MTEPKLTLYGANWCPDCRNTKVFLGEMDVPYHWVDIDLDPGANEKIAALNNGKRVIPTLVLPDGTPMVNPSNAALAEALGLVNKASRPFYDLIVIGSGPAGLTAALYAGREGQSVLVIDKGPIGGQVSITDRLDNFPGFPEGIEGREFSKRLATQAERFGVEILAATEVASIDWGPNCRSVTTTGGQTYAAPALLLSTGSTYRRLNVPGEEGFIGAGVHFCATCDGPFYKDQPVVVVGGGNSAVEESLFLTRFVSRIDLLVRGDELTASKVLIEKALQSDQITVHYNTSVKRLEGGDSLERIVVEQDGAEKTIETAAAFLFIGLKPNTAWLPGSIDLDPSGFLLTSTSLETSLPGVFAAGDARLGSTKQAASAAGEGAAVALMIRNFLNQRPDLAAQLATSQNV